MKNEFNAQKKNLMNSISTLQKKLEKIETESHSDKRVEIINKLREERKDQQQTILLLRKYILNSAKEDKEAEELKLNKYLIEYRKEKYGEQRYISYEELKIQLDELEKKYQILKKSKGGAPTSTRSYMNPKEKTKKIPESEIQLLVVKNEYDIKIKNLENENNILKKQKEEIKADDPAYFIEDNILIATEEKNNTKKNAKIQIIKFTNFNRTLKHNISFNTHFYFLGRKVIQDIFLRLRIAYSKKF